MLEPGIPEASAAAAQSFDTSRPLTFAQHLEADDVYVRETDSGNTLIVIPGIWTTMPPPLLEAMRARRRASVTGQCPACGAAYDTSSASIFHEPDCAASDDLLRPSLEEWGRRVGRYARGRRILEDPT